MIKNILVQNKNYLSSYSQHLTYPVSVLNLGGSLWHFSITKGQRSMNLHSVGASSKLGGIPLMYVGVSPLNVGIDFNSP